MNGLHWPLVSLVILCLIAIGWTYIIRAEWKRAGEPMYRTADRNAIRRQTARIIANASAHHFEPCIFGHLNLDAVRSQGTTAALHDMGQKTCTAPTTNPHASDTLAHFTWRKAYLLEVALILERRGAA